MLDRLLGEGTAELDRLLGEGTAVVDRQAGEERLMGEEFDSTQHKLNRAMISHID